MKIAIYNRTNALVRLCCAARPLVRLLMLFLSVSIASPTIASDLSRISVFALGPLDGRAVFKYADGKMAILKLGESLAGTEARLVQVLADRAVLEDLRQRDGRQAVRELVWLYKADVDGASAIQRFSPEAPTPTRIESVK